uniref:NADH-ubiquinone oxidoreductase chain 6 n=1 Tax=Rhinostomus barbirostris TaxID=206507 RepID=A0A346RID1_9CUCU|nr:NADH dehydrogenase subunit 6 [Rhinostomus barbirostris]
MLTLLISLVVMSMMFLSFNHPLTMSMILLVTSMLVSLSAGAFFPSFWYSYIMFLVMVGGMLVLVIYMTSVASNEKFKFPLKSTVISLLFAMIFMIIPHEYMQTVESLSPDCLPFNAHETSTYFFNKYYNLPGVSVMILMMIYLLLTLIMVVKITDIKSGPLRQMF